MRISGLLRYAAVAMAFLTLQRTQIAIKRVGASVENQGLEFTPTNTDTGAERVRLVSLVFGDSLARSRRFRLFLESAKTAGDRFDFLLLGDFNDTGLELPPNVRHHQITFAQLVDRIVDKIFDNNVSDGSQLQTLYRDKGYQKCIDFKPLMGFLFPELLNDVAWWGHCDNDIVFGNLDKFFNQSYLKQHDIISGSNDSPTFAAWGPFQLYRNIEPVNTLFRHFSHPNMTLQNLLLTPVAHAFDEKGWSKLNKFQPYGMSFLVRHVAPTLGLRATVAEGLMMNDIKECKWLMKGVSKERCGECNFHRNGTLTVLRKQDLGGLQEVWMCHFQKGKKLIDHDLDETMSEDVWKKNIGDPNMGFNMSQMFGFRWLPQ